MICGVDEAGRGPVMGPLVVAAVMVKDQRALCRLQVRDSKQLTRKRREELALRIRELAQVEVTVLSAEEIDQLRDEASLNVVEAHLFASLVEKLKPSKAYIDAADVVEHRFRRMIERELTCQPVIVCEHRADENYPVCSAASIIAKTVRDDLVDRIAQDLGEDIGSGYAHDQVTRDFMDRYIRRHGDFPPHTRRSWRTAKEIYAMTKLTKLTDWVRTDDSQADY